MAYSNEDSLHLTSRPCLAKRVRLQIDPVSGRPVLLNQEAIILLNKTGHEIVLRCDGTRTLSEIIEELENQYAIAKTTLARDVSKYVENLSQKGLLEWI
jgi:pyrroloquinoline quinone biosynthesis protein D